MSLNEKNAKNGIICAMLEAFLRFLMVWFRGLLKMSLLWRTQDSRFVAPKLSASRWAQQVSIGRTCLKLIRTVCLEYCFDEKNKDYSPNELRNAVIFFIEFAITSMYSRLAQSWWICRWIASRCASDAIFDRFKYSLVSLSFNWNFLSSPAWWASNSTVDTVDTKKRRGNLTETKKNQNTVKSNCEKCQ